MRVGCLLLSFNPRGARSCLYIFMRLPRAVKGSAYTRARSAVINDGDAALLFFFFCCCLMSGRRKAWVYGSRLVVWEFRVCGLWGFWVDGRTEWVRSVLGRGLVDIRGEFGKLNISEELRRTCFDWVSTKSYSRQWIYLTTFFSSRLWWRHCVLLFLSLALRIWLAFILHEDR